MKSGGNEIEIKLRVPSVGWARRRVLSLGYRVSAPRVFEVNRVFDTPAADLRNSRRLLRLRTAGRVHTVTFKGPPEGGGRHRSRPEVESAVPDAAVFERIFEGLGYWPSLRYEKYRTEFSKPRAGGIVMLDELPFGLFLELEGAPRWIDRTAKELGFAESDYITMSYAALHLEDCARRGVVAGDIVFPRKH